MKATEPVVGVRELRARLSAFLREVADGSTVTIGDRQRRPIARLVPVRRADEISWIERLAERGVAQVGSGKPGANPPIKPRRTRRAVSDLVIEDRR